MFNYTAIIFSVCIFSSLCSSEEDKELGKETPSTVVLSSGHKTIIYESSLVIKRFTVNSEVQ